MNSRGEFKLQGMIISLLVAFGLFFGLIAGSITLLGGVYDTTGYDNETLADYNQMNSLAGTLEAQQNSIEDTTINPGAFDFFSDIFNKILAPFKFIYRTYRTMTTLSSSAVDDLNLMPIFKVFFSSVIIVLVIVGIVLIKFYQGRSK